MALWHGREVALIVALPAETQGLFAAGAVPVHYCGIGKVNAAFKTTEVILKSGCRRVINLGTAGSHRFPTHTLVECRGFIQKDIDLSPLGYPKCETPLDDLGGLVLENETFLPDLAQGICATGDRFETTPPQFACDLVDMEAYAMAKVCRRLGVGFTAIKYITDGSDATSHQNWAENLIPASRRLREVFERLVQV